MKKEGERVKKESERVKKESEKSARDISREIRDFFERKESTGSTERRRMGRLGALMRKKGIVIVCSFSS